MLRKLLCGGQKEAVRESNSEKEKEAGKNEENNTPQENEKTPDKGGGDQQNTEAPPEGLADKAAEVVKTAGAQLWEDAIKEVENAAEPVIDKANAINEVMQKAP